MSLPILQEAAGILPVVNPMPDVEAALGREKLAFPASDYSLYNLDAPSNPQALNKQILMKQALKAILEDHRPSKALLMKMQHESINNLHLIASMVKDKPTVRIPDEIAAILDPKMLANARNKCWDTSGPGGLPKAKCVIPGKTRKGRDGKTYVAVQAGKKRKWQRVDDSGLPK